MIKIIPAILVRSAEEFERQVNAIKTQANWLQLDIADGDFVPNKTWAQPKGVRNHRDINFELHLMVKDPLRELEKWVDIKNVKRIFIHFESNKNRDAGLKFAKQHGWQIGLAINPATPVSKIEKYLDKIDALLFMGVNPGFQGQNFVHSVLKKIKEFKTAHPKLPVGLDGAVNFITLPEIIKTDVDAVCIGSAIFGNQKTPIENIENIRKILSRHSGIPPVAGKKYNTKYN